MPQKKLQAKHSDYQAIKKKLQKYCKKILEIMCYFKKSAYLCTRF